MIFRVFASAACALAFSLVASAQSIPNFEGVATSQIALSDTIVVPNCVGNDRAYRRVSAEESAYLTDGERLRRDQGIRIFRERYEASGCGAPPRMHNVQIFDGTPLPQPVVRLLPPGETAITAGILGDVFDQVLPVAAAARHPECHPGGERPQFVIANTGLVAGRPFEVNTPWTERWSWEACGVPDTLDVQFTYDGRGVRMAASVDPPR